MMKSYREHSRFDCLCLVIDGTKAILARILFFGHSIFSVWAATCVTGERGLWGLLGIQILFIFETIYSIYKRKGREPKWFSPCILLYLFTVVPPVWIINLSLFGCMHAKALGNDSCNDFSEDNQMCSFAKIYTYLDQKVLVYTIHQIMLLLLIIGRWLLPKGNVSREHLSMLLLVYFSISFDIMEIFILYEEQPILQTNGLQYIILTLWTVSLLQFAFVLTSTKVRRPRLSLDPNGIKLRLVTCCQSDLWSLSMNVIMQDGPFLVLRLYCFIGLDIFSYNLLVYTAKNILIILLQGYRIIVLLCQCHEELEDQKQDINASMASLSYSTPKRTAEVIVTRPQPYTIDKTGKLTHNPNLTLDVSSNTLDSRDLNFVTSV